MISLFRAQESGKPHADYITLLVMLLLFESLLFAFLFILLNRLATMQEMGGFITGFTGFLAGWLVKSPMNPVTRVETSATSTETQH